MTRKKGLFFSMILLLFTPVQDLLAQDHLVRQKKLTRFEMQYSGLINATGEVISSAGYRSNVYWFPVDVPSTVLTGLVANRVYPDPYTGMNNMLIPDASDRFNKEYKLEQYSHLPNVGNPWKKPYWYRTSFDVPAVDKGRHFQLIFKGINYRAAVWLNGSQIADSTRMAGMFAEYSFDVSDLVRAGEKNFLAVKIYPLDEPGYPDKEQLKAFGDFFLNGGPTGDIGKNVTMLCSVGWDWMPPVRDRNMGIWQPVILRTSGKVTFANPHLVTDLELSDTTVAKLSLDLSLVNHDSQASRGTLSVDIRPENFVGHPVVFTQEVSIAAGGKSRMKLDAGNTEQLLIKEPRLWWPNGYGEANLYRIRLQYESGGITLNDTSFVFGIRTVGSKVVQEKGKSLRRDFYVNGRRVHLNGGAWVPDMMLNRDSLRYVYELQLCKNANMNLVRIWGGGITPPDVFFDLADRYGLMVWSDFWITGDTQGEFKGSPDWPLESEVFKKNVVSTILRIRNHPSLLVWTGGNEGHARKELYEAMRNGVIELDGTRPFIPSSSGFAHLPEEWPKSWPDEMDSGVYSGGPYTWQDPKEYYTRVNAGKDWVFKDETGIPSQPTYNSLKKIIPNLVWDTTLPFPLNHTWGYHDAATGNGRYDLYYEEMVKRYGSPESMKDFSDKMQLMNAMGYQGIFESAGHKLNETGGVMLWKLNAAFPSVIWQIYDWYLNPNAGYYFMQNALEPVHVQLNPLNYNVMVVNRTYQSHADLTVEAAVYGPDSELLHQDTATVNLDTTDVRETVSLARALAETDEVRFVAVRLKDQAGKVISGNTYWFAADNDYTAMNTMPRAEVRTDVVAVRQSTTDKTWTLRFTNDSKRMAFFLNPQILDRGEEALPSFWSANYLTLIPGESVTVTVRVPLANLKDQAQQILLDGWNIEKQLIAAE
ncbi:MAG: glycoside hydrolase family 2 TIM barrel-domain containing protein [Mangrovibacterium sp.]|nr:glycoside hydrolase family 2 TIM barrel-domain containing protein [Mangrovibacterium sp.]